MATVTLKNIKKIYPHAEETKKKKRVKKGEEQPEKKVNLQITEQGVYKYTKSPSGDITITLTESGRYRLYAISDGELAGTISTSEERLKRIELYHGYDCILEYDLVAGETYTLSFDLFGRSLRLDLVKM